MRFLAGADIQKKVRTIGSRDGEVLAAVAYWGKGAAKRTGLAKHRRPADVRIICDLMSGACNPNEVDDLKKLGFRVKTLNHLHAKVWIGGDNIIVGSANASQNGLLGEGERAADANVEAAVLLHDPTLARAIRAWFEEQWCASDEIKDRHLDEARRIWKRRQRSGGRGFTSPLTEEMTNPDSRDQFSGLRLLAYLNEGASREADNYFSKNAGKHYTDDERQDLGDEKPWYEWPLGDPEWSHPPGTVFADFSCSKEGGQFTFNGLWQVRHSPSIDLKKTRLTLLNPLPHFNGYSPSPDEKEAFALRIRETVAQLGHRTDEYGDYIDEKFLDFWNKERTELRQRLVARVADAAGELSHAGRFDPSITLLAIRACARDPEWLTGYARFVGGDPYRHSNPLKKRINPGFAKSVKARLGARNQVDRNGRSVTEDVEGEIIQRYTLLAK